MSKSVFVSLTILCCCLQLGICQYEGDGCVTQHGTGVCKIITECPNSAADLQKGIRPQICGFSGKTAVVCCVQIRVESKQEECGPVPETASRVSRTGSKAWDKCLDLLGHVYPCKNITRWEPCSQNDNQKLCDRTTVSRIYKCGHYEPPIFQRLKRADEDDKPVHTAAVGGVDSVEKEFPHMALLGFGQRSDTAAWVCGGTIISENFILTAGHCTYARDFGNVQFIRVGMARVSSPIERNRLYIVGQIIKHPDYKPPSKYNDIALLRTTTEIKMDEFVYPACLHTGNDIDDRNMVATGWGLLQYLGNTADILQRVDLQPFSTEECSNLIKPSRTQKFGLDPKTQLCAGHHQLARDTCQGDSGGPLQIYHPDVNCMYLVLGITSFGWGCGIIGSPGVYTRISYYIPWIESIVWP